MYKIRPGVFETNSSSTHTLSIMTDYEYHFWESSNNVFLIDFNKVNSSIGKWAKDNNKNIITLEELKSNFPLKYKQYVDYANKYYTNEVDDVDPLYLHLMYNGLYSNTLFIENFDMIEKEINDIHIISGYMDEE